jgi:hypothetical protein
VDAEPSLEPVEMRLGLGGQPFPVAQQDIGRIEILDLQVALIGDQPVAVAGQVRDIQRGADADGGHGMSFVAGLFQYTCRPSRQTACTTG